MEQKIIEQYNVDKAWNNLQAKLIEDGFLEKTTKKRMIYNPIIKVAAIFAIGLLITWISLSIYNSLLNNLQYVENKSNMVKEITLSDGSFVYLNRNSVLRFPNKFAKGQRSVVIEGEAFFNIRHMNKKPFVVLAGNAEIQVLGTSFSVKTDFKEPDKVEVFVKTGLVNLHLVGENNNKILLEAGYVGMLKDKNLRKKKNENINYLSWKTKYFVFEGESLQNVISIINHAYGVKIVFDNKNLERKAFYSTFNNESLDTVIKLICTANNLRAVRFEDKILLKAN